MKKHFLKKASISKSLLFYTLLTLAFILISISYIGTQIHLQKNSVSISLPSLQTWNFETVISQQYYNTHNGNKPRSLNLTLQNAQTPLIEFTHDGDGDIAVATFLGTGQGNCEEESRWSCESIERVHGGDNVNPLFLNQNKVPATPYQKSGTKQFHYAQYIGENLGNCSNANNWNCEVVDTAPYSAANNDLILFDNTLVAAYYQTGVANDLKFAEYRGSGLGNCFSGSNWDCEIVDFAGVVGVNPQLILDAQNNLYIFYLSADNGRLLRYAKFVGTGGNCNSQRWNCGTIDANVQHKISTAIDSHGKIAVAYYNSAQQDLKFATFVGSNGNCGAGEWNCETVASSGDSGRNKISLKKRSDGTLIIAYINNNTNTLFLATKTQDVTGDCFAGSAWNCEAVITAQGNIWSLDMEIDENDDLHLAYVDAGNNSIHYSRRTSSLPQTSNAVRRIADQNNGVQPPQPVTNISFTFTENPYTILLTWNDPVDDGLRHEILRNHHPLADVINGSPYAAVPRGTNTFTDQMVMPGKTYTYIVRSVNAFQDQANSEQITVSIPAPRETPLKDLSTEDASATNEPIMERKGSLESGHVYRTRIYPEIYYIASDNKRYVFTSDDVYLSWYENFNSIKLTSPEELSAYPLSGAITHRPDVHILEIESLNEIYIVENASTLRKIVSTDIANELFGENWRQYIIQVNVALLAHYQMGPDIVTPSDYTHKGGIDETGCSSYDAFIAACVLEKDPAFGELTHRPLIVSQQFDEIISVPSTASPPLTASLPQKYLLSFFLGAGLLILLVTSLIFSRNNT